VAVSATTIAPVTKVRKNAAADTAAPTYSVPSSCTPISWTNTFAFTSNTACPTPYEVGTFCGFINPEDPCSPQPYGYGPSTNPDSVQAFKDNLIYHALALSAPTPSGYTNTFRDLNASVIANSYLAYKSLTSYNVTECASYCNSTQLCTGFNLYIERDPQWNPDRCTCQNPASMANYKCSLWGSDVGKDSATNYGEARNDFTVIIVGSNGYQLTSSIPPTPKKARNIQDCHKRLFNRPKYSLGQHSFPGPFDPSLCAAYALQQNTVNKKAGVWGRMGSAKCVQFQAAELLEDGAGWGTHCRLFTRRFPSNNANLRLGGGNNGFTCGKSYTWDIE
ncbi:hypothetical protein P280DRAFT_366555, partial [Massarina eburnea CBS 473.64]